MMGCVKPGGTMDGVYGVSGSLVPRRRGGMRPVGLLVVAVALMAPGWGGVRWLWSGPRTDLALSGRWSGTWRGHVMGIARTDDATADLVQQGARGTGRLTLHTTGAVLGVPVALRNAGLTGVRVQFDVSRNDVVMRHELGGSVFRADFKVEGDRMVGYIRDRSEEHTSELQSQSNLVCRLLLEKKKKIK